MGENFQAIQIGLCKVCGSTKKGKGSRLLVSSRIYFNYNLDISKVINVKVA